MKINKSIFNKKKVYNFYSTGIIMFIIISELLLNLWAIVL